MIKRLLAWAAGAGISWPLAAGIAAVMGLLATGLVWRAERDAAAASAELAAAQRDQALAAAVQNARAAEEIARHGESLRQALEDELRAARERAASLQKVLAEIANAPDGQACAASPSVRRALEYLADRVFQPP